MRKPGRTTKRATRSTCGASCSAGLEQRMPRVDEQRGHTICASVSANSDRASRSLIFILGFPLRMNDLMKSDAKNEAQHGGDENTVENRFPGYSLRCSTHVRNCAD